MAEVQIRIGGRPFTVACQPGEEAYLEAAAGKLDAEAQVLVGQLGKLPEAQMLLMAGLMLADKMAGLMERTGAPATASGPDSAALAQLTALADRAEAIAAALEAKAAAA